ncbi:MAG: response regulator [Desulfobacterales bacterium]|nr:response regulator [Desulfobacterales bacterium]
MFRKIREKHHVSKRHIILLIICVAALDIAFVAFFYIATIRGEVKQYVEYLIAISGGVSTQMTSLGLFLERDAVHLSRDEAIKNWVYQAQKSLQAEGGGRGGMQALEIRNELHNYLYSRFHWIKRMKKGMGKMPGITPPPPPPVPVTKLKGIAEQNIQFVIAPKNVSFLRTHKPDQYGDVPSTYKNLFQQAEQQNVPLNGLDIGPYYAGLRGVAPISLNGQNEKNGVIGYVEVGQSFESILINLKNLLNAQKINIDFAVLLKKGAAEAVVGNGASNWSRTCTANYDVIAATEAVPPIVCRNKRFNGILESLPDGCLVKSEGQFYVVGAMPDPMAGLKSMKKSDQKRDLAFVTWFSVAPQHFRDVLFNKLGGALIFGGVSFVCLMTALVMLWHFASKKLNRLVDSKTAELAETNRDLTVAKEDAEAAKEQAEAANKAKSEFLANMSHEIRTPMNAIIGIGDLMTGTRLNTKQSEYLDVLRSSSRSLLGLLNDILDFSKIEADQLDLEHIPFQLRSLIEEVSDTFRGKSAEKQIEFIVDIEPEAPDGLLGDPLRLKQVLINLLSNAFKFTERGEIQLLVQATNQTAERAGLTFSVRDTGIGIDPQKMDNLFIAFTQADTSVSRRYGGTGLGLSISQRLVLLMSGNEIEIESETGVGSTFRFEIAFDIAGAPDRRDWMVPTELKDLCALIVEGNQGSRRSLERALTDFGLTFQSVGSAEDALRVLAQPQPAGGFGLILLDLKHTGVDGLEAVEKIRNIPPYANRPIILTSIYREEELFEDLESAAICAFLIKPVRRSALFDAIMECMGFELQKRSAVEVKTFASYFEGTRILLAEDNVANQMVASEILNQAGFSVEVAGSGKAAVEMCRRKDYAAVLMDVQMPEMDGIEATIEIRNILASEKLPIIAMTANAMRGDREKCLSAGMNDYVSKPINSIELLNTLKKWIPQSRSDRPVRDMNAVPERTIPVDAPTGEKPPSLPGIDVEGGLRRLGINWESFKKILVEFKKSQPQELERLRQAFDAQDFDTVRLKAHSLAGIGGNIAAEALKAACKSIEKAAHRGDKKDIQTRLPGLQAEFERVIEGISTIEETARPATVAPVDSGFRLEDLDTLYQSLRDLQKYLSDFDPVGTETARSRIEDTGVPTEMKSDYHELCRQLQDLDYAAAQAALTRMQNMLQDIMRKES